MNNINILRICVSEFIGGIMKNNLNRGNKHLMIHLNYYFTKVQEKNVTNINQWFYGFESDVISFNDTSILLYTLLHEIRRKNKNKHTDLNIQI